MSSFVGAMHAGLTSTRVVTPRPDRDAHLEAPSSKYVIGDACVLWETARGTIVCIVGRHAYPSDSAYQSAVEEALARYGLTAAALANYQDALVLPGLIDLDGSVFDVENSGRSVEQVTCSYAQGGVTTVVDIPRSSAAGSTWQARVTALDEATKHADVAPFEALSDHCPRSTDTVSDDEDAPSAADLGSIATKALGWYASLSPGAEGLPESTVDDVAAAAFISDDHVDAKPLFVAAEMYTSKALRIASPHRSEPMAVRYDPTYEVDHPANMYVFLFPHYYCRSAPQLTHTPHSRLYPHRLGPVSSSSSSNPGHTFGTPEDETTAKTLPLASPPIDVLRENSRDSLVMSPMVTPLEQRKTVTIVHSSPEWHRAQTSGDAGTASPASALSGSWQAKNNFLGAVLNSELKSYKYAHSSKPVRFGRRPSDTSPGGTARRTSTSVTSATSHKPLALTRVPGEGTVMAPSTTPVSLSPCHAVAIDTRRPGSPAKFNFSPPKALIMNKPSSLLARRNFSFKPHTNEGGGASSPPNVGGNVEKFRRKSRTLSDGEIKIYKMADPLTRAAISSNYDVFLGQRPPEHEVRAVRKLLTVLDRASDHSSLTATPRARLRPVHFVRMSSAVAMAIVHTTAKEMSVPVSTGTCPHYLLFDSDSRLNACTLLKCSPPVRDAANRAALLAERSSYLASGHVEFGARLKLLHTGDLVRAVGGVNAAPSHASAVWTAVLGAGGTVLDMVERASAGPARLVGLGSRKGRIDVGHDADFCIFQEGALHTSMLPRTSPYRGSNSILVSPIKGMPQPIKLRGEVLATFLRGRLVYAASTETRGGGGQTLLAVH